MNRLGLIVAALALLAGVQQASAYPGYASGNVNLRSGPGTGYGVIVVVPYRAPIEVYGCNYGWCEISWKGYRGYISARYIGRGGYSGGYSGGGSYGGGYRGGYSSGY